MRTFFSILSLAVLIPALAHADDYPLKTCVVSGEKLDGEMGSPVEYHYKGRTIRFCCDSCIPKFQKDPEKYLKALDEAAAKAKGDNK